MSTYSFTIIQSRAIMGFGKFLAVSLVLGSVGAYAQTPFNRVSCPNADVSLVPSGKTVESFSRTLRSNRITLVNQVSVNYLEEFLFEFNKFPKPLMREMISQRADIHLIQGQGVTEDPSWDPIHVKTFDNRPWSEVPGSGGFPFKKSLDEKYKKDMIRYCRAVPTDSKCVATDFTKFDANGVPTRVVVNQLYRDRAPHGLSSLVRGGNHGSINLFLHEHGHSLDNIYRDGTISKLTQWKELLDSDSNSHRFMMGICGTYCTQNLNEAFAELFAYYHSCDASRHQMEQEVPKIAEFFRELTSVKNYLNKVGAEAPARTTGFGGFGEIFGQLIR